MPFRRAARLDQLPPYLFIEIDNKKAAAIAEGREVIDFGVGDPDRPTPEFIIDRMAEAIYDPRNHHYPFGTGTLEFREACAEWMKKRFHASVDPSGEILALLGSKEGLGHLPVAVVNPGDVVLIPTPAYPVYLAATIFAGGVPHLMPLVEQRGFLPDLDEIPAEVLDKTALMFLNYPNNPTGAVAPLDYYERCVRLARAHDFLICSDAPYTELYFDEADRPHSMLEVSGAKEVCIEMHSFSKTFNMTGWRIAFAAGNSEVLAALAKVKGNMDSGVFAAVQHAAVAALRNCDHPEVAGIRAVYARRRDLLVAGLNRAGFRVQSPRATFYVWARCPEGYSSMPCAAKLLDEADIVAVPGIGFGEPGDDYVRLALTVRRRRIEEAVNRLMDLKW
jgi:LL-diaminopimelate aminotransferase